MCIIAASQMLAFKEGYQRMGGYAWPMGVPDRSSGRKYANNFPLIFLH